MTRTPTRTHPPSCRDELIALNLTPGLSRSALCRLGAELMGCDGHLLDAARRARWTRAQLTVAGQALLDARSVARHEIEAAQRHGAHLVTVLETTYPEALGDLQLPPPVLYVRGEMPAGNAVAIVGSRRTDEYGRDLAGLFGRELAAAGVSVISGFALGVDAAAHRGALAAHDGRTVAVLGCGLGVDYPRGHQRLAAQIATAGALITEFAVGQSPDRWHFPVRNRLIAALSNAVLVVRATARSGSLNTARWALDLGREICALPGSIFDERSIGANALIRDGAHLVQHPREILEILGIRPEKSAPLEAPEPPSATEAASSRLLGALPPGAERRPDVIAEALGEGIDRVLALLLEAELEGSVRRLPGGLYRRTL